MRATFRAADNREAAFIELAKRESPTRIVQGVIVQAENETSKALVRMRGAGNIVTCDLAQGFEAAIGDAVLVAMLHSTSRPIVLSAKRSISSYLGAGSAGGTPVSVEQPEAPSYISGTVLSEAVLIEWWAPIRQDQMFIVEANTEEADGGDAVLVTQGSYYICADTSYTSYRVACAMIVNGALVRSDWSDWVTVVTMPIGDAADRASVSPTSPGRHFYAEDTGAFSIVNSAGDGWIDPWVVAPGETLTVTTGGTLALGGYTLTVPATGIAVLGGGAANRVAYWSGANTLTSHANFTYTAAGPLLLQSPTATNVGLVVQSTDGSTTSNLTEWKDNGAVVRSYISGDGRRAGFGTNVAVTAGVYGVISAKVAGGDYSAVRAYADSDVMANSATSIRGFSADALYKRAFDMGAVVGLSGQACTGAGFSAGTLFSLSGLDFNVIHAGAGTVTISYGARAIVNNTSTGQIGTGYGIAIQITNTSTGTIPSGYGAWIGSAVNSGGGAFFNNWALYIQDQNIATNNWAIVTNAGNVVFNEGGDADTDLRFEGDTNTHLLFADAGLERVGINRSSPAGKLDVYQSAEDGAVPVLKLEQKDVSEEFTRYVGTAAAATLDRSLVAEADVATATRAGFKRVYIVDDGDQIADGPYYVPFYTLS